MQQTTEIEGWFLDIHPNPKGGITLWLMGMDGRHYQLRQDFPIIFYAAGKNEQLRDAWQYLKSQPVPVSLSRTERCDLFNGMLTVMAIEVKNPGDQPGLFAKLSRQFPNLTYYDSDLQLSLRHAAIYGTFPLAYCNVTMDEAHWIKSISVLDSPWNPDPIAPPLTVVSIEPDVDPSHAEPKQIHIQTPRERFSLNLSMPAQALLASLQSMLTRYDPDLLITAHGDTWVLPHLLKLSAETGLTLSLNRATDEPVQRKTARSYFAYGQVIYRGAQVHLSGRWHIDIYNTVMYHDYGLEGVWELARITSLPVQTVARVSPGTGISSMQITTALKQGILVPWHKQQAEAPKTALELLHADMGGLVYQPTVGLHKNVAEIDFISMYPGIMAHFNISPETILPGQYDPQTGLPLTRQGTGLIPKTLQPLLQKRIALKGQLLTLPKWDARHPRYKAMASAHKWLLVTCFGYLGYKNARFGRIEAHEAVTAYGREALLRAKEAAEQLGYEVLHLYVDGMWVKKSGCARVEDFGLLLAEIHTRTGLPIALDGIFKWVAFLPSRQNKKVPVANRYFGVFQDGEIKMRGIETRRHDTPPFITRTQIEILQQMAKVPADGQLSDVLPGVRMLLRKKIRALREHQIPLQEFVIRHTMSRVSEQYRGFSPAAEAVRQLESAGKSMRPGQRVRFIFTLGHPGVTAWDLCPTPEPASLNIPRYLELLLRSVETVFTPLGLSRRKLEEWLFDEAYSVPLQGMGGEERQQLQYLLAP